MNAVKNLKLKLLAVEALTAILIMLVIFFFIHLCLESSFSIPTWRVNGESWKIGVLFATHICAISVFGWFGYKLNKVKESLIFSK